MTRLTRESYQYKLRRNFSNFSNFGTSMLIDSYTYICSIAKVEQGVNLNL